MESPSSAADKYETVIGLEVHAQLKTKSKMFCGCSADYANAPPNTHVCQICLGMPGVLPVVNRRAVEFTIMTALALKCMVSEYTKFDRKNYPYPDLMKGYQISQYDAPIGIKGEITIDVNGERRGAAITRVHLEEDVAKMVHRAGIGGTYSLVDVNRSGTPLMEIVGEPDLRSPEEARQYLVKLRNILQYLDVSTANMEEGSFRCDANISIRPLGGDFGPKVEVKNMNSFRAVFRAMEYEAKRQRQVVESGGRVVQETRGWVEDKGQTVSQRTKEYAHDYRYFPEPDLPPLQLERKWVDEIEAGLPELPEEKCTRFISQYGLPTYDAGLLTSSKMMADYFEVLAATRMARSAKEASNWIVGPVSAIMNLRNVDMAEFDRKVSAQRLGELLAMEAKGAVNTVTAKAVLEEMFESGRPAGEIVAGKGLEQISDGTAIEAQVALVVASNPQAVADFRRGKEASMKFLMGQVMKATGGRANPQMVNALLKKRLTGE